MTSLEHEPVKVHITRDDTKEPDQRKQPKEVVATFRNYVVSNTAEPQMILGHAPGRIHTILQITNGGPIVLGESRSAVQAQNSDTAQWIVAANGPITLYTTREVWAQNTVGGVTNIAVIAEYEER